MPPDLDFSSKTVHTFHCMLNQMLILTYKSKPVPGPRQSSENEPEQRGSTLHVAWLKNRIMDDLISYNTWPPPFWHSSVGPPVSLSLQARFLEGLLSGMCPICLPVHSFRRTCIWGLSAPHVTEILGQTSETERGPLYIKLQKTLLLLLLCYRAVFTNRAPGFLSLSWGLEEVFLFKCPVVVAGQVGYLLWAHMQRDTQMHTENSSLFS